MSRFRLLLGPRTPPTVIGPQPVFRMGMNLSGAETSIAQFPTSDEMSYFTQRGVKTFRLPLLWENIQGSLGGSLASVYMTKVSGVLAMAAGLGATILIDIHSYGLYAGKIMGQPGGPTVANFADLWTRLSTFFKADPNYAAVRGYDLMNEWHDMDPNAGPGVNSTPYSQNLIASANQAAITAIRANGDTKTIYVEGDHYSGAWDWVANNGTWAAALTDPANNLIFSVHCYLDSDSSGTNFVWASEIAKPGYAPPGTPTSVNIGPQRMAAVIAWARQNNKRLHVGETGWSNDTITQGGNDDFADWNQAAYNHILNCQNNLIEMDIWGAGPTFSAAYGYNPEPTSVANPSAKDFTTAGLQSTQMVVIEKFTGYTGAQPTAYRVDPPYNAVPYAPPGSAIPNFKIRYNGKLANGVAFTPKALLPDGSSAGGTFTATAMPAGDNGLVTFSYTPASALAGIGISFTNNGGLTDPLPIGCASSPDLFTPLTARPVNVFALRRLIAFYVGPAIRLQRASDSAQNDFYFNNRGDLPRQAIQDWAGSRSIPIVTVYDQARTSDLGHVAGSTFAVLSLTNAAGYPEVTHPANAQYYFASPANGNTAQTIVARVNDGNGSAFFLSQDGTGYPFRFSPNEYQVDNNTGNIRLGRVSGEWHHYGATFSAGGLQVGYKDGVQTASQAAPSAPFSNQNAGTALGYFPYYQQNQWTGSWQTVVIMNIALSAAQEKTFSDSDATYYSTALPDTLGAVAPTISGAGPQSVTQGSFLKPFVPVTISDTNGGGATDSVSIAISGSAGSLTGTGLSGSAPGPYTLAADTPANVTAKLQGLTWTPSGAAGSSTTFAITVNSSAGTSVTNSATVVSVQSSQAETPLAAPSGTWTPVAGAAAWKGVNISGAEVGYPASSQYNYIYPEQREVNYFAAKGFGIIRMPITQGRFYPNPYGLLDPAGRTDEPAAANTPTGAQTNLYMTKRALDMAFAKGMRVIIDAHNYGQMADSRISAFRTIGADPEGTNLFVDMWSRIATVFKNYPNVVFGLQNEPVNCSPQQFHDAAIAALAGIRAAGANQLVLIAGGGNFDDAEAWSSTGGGTLWDTFNQPGWTGANGDPANNFAFEGHKYFDTSNDGNHSTYRNVTGAALLGGMTTWCRQTNAGTTRANPFRAFLGEMGWVPDSSVTSRSGQAAVSGSVQPSGPSNSMLDFMSANSDVWLGWTFFVGGSWAFNNTYQWGHVVPQNYGGDPSAYVDQPQMAQLTAHL